MEYGSLPENIPTHVNAQGNVEKYMGIKNFIFKNKRQMANLDDGRHLNSTDNSICCFENNRKINSLLEKGGTKLKLN